MTVDELVEALQERQRRGEGLCEVVLKDSETGGWRKVDRLNRGSHDAPALIVLDGDDPPSSYLSFRYWGGDDE